MYIGAFKQFIHQYQVAITLLYFLRSQLHTLYFGKKVTFTEEDIIFYLHIGDDPIQETDSICFCGHTHAYMRQQRTQSQTAQQGALPRHISPGQEQHILLLPQTNIIAYRLLQQGMKQLSSLQFNILFITDLRHYKAQIKCSLSHTKPGIHMGKLVKYRSHIFFQATAGIITGMHQFT
ncbi:hypothetical protein D3C80_1303820 [compost metagenome]